MFEWTTEDVKGENEMRTARMRTILNNVTENFKISIHFFFLFWFFFQIYKYTAEKLFGTKRRRRRRRRWRRWRTATYRLVSHRSSLPLASTAVGIDRFCAPSHRIPRRRVWTNEKDEKITKDERNTRKNTKQQQRTHNTQKKAKETLGRSSSAGLHPLSVNYYLDIFNIGRSWTSVKSARNGKKNWKLKFNCTDQFVFWFSLTESFKGNNY